MRKEPFKKKPVEKIFVVPAEGMRVKDPITLRPLKPEGEEKPRTTYWVRRIRCGDCTLGKAPQAPRPEATQAPAPKKPDESKKTKSKKDEPKKGDDQ